MERRRGGEEGPKRTIKGPQGGGGANERTTDRKGLGNARAPPALDLEGGLGSGELKRRDWSV